MSLPLLPILSEPATDADARARFEWYVAMARWAPSKHNAQPWQFVVRGESLEIWPDRLRSLQGTDPWGRELIISCGAAVEHACVAARAHGFVPRVTVLPEGHGGCLARIVEEGRCQPGAEDRALLDAIPIRRTDRGPLDSGPLAVTLPHALQAAAAARGSSLRFVTTPGDRATLAHLVERADRLLVQRGEVTSELAEWVREPDDPRADGVPSDHTRGAAASYRSEFVQRDFSTAGAVPTQDRTGVDNPLIGVLYTPAEGERHWIAAGRSLSAVLLRARADGANSSYLNQPIEHTAIRTQLNEQFALAGVAQLVLRIGIGGEVAPTPRRSPAELTVTPH